MASGRVNANDEPLLPEDFHWLLIEGALVKVALLRAEGVVLP